MGVVLAVLAEGPLGERLDMSKALGALGTSNVPAVLGYVVLLAVPLYLVARRVQRPEV